MPQVYEPPAPQPAEMPATQPPGFFRTIMSGLFGNSPSTDYPSPQVPGEDNPFAQEPGEANPFGEVPVPAAIANEKVEIQTDYDIALREAQLRNRPLLVVFGATWCSWCRKLEEDLGKLEAQSLLSEWIIVKVDVDEEPELASRLEASALPALRILDPLEKRVASQEGYLEPAALAEWLSANRKSADPIVQRALFDTAPPDDAAVEQLVALMAEATPATRSAAMERLAAHPSQSAEALVQTVKKGRLIQQLSACDILKRWDAPLGQIDPWRPESLNEAQFATLVAWSKKRKAADANEVTNDVPPEGDSEAIADLLGRLIRADAGQRQSLIAQLIGMGPAVAVEVRKQLSDADAVNDASREGLRELLYNLLASRELRLKQPGVLAALARLDAESHRQAAAVVLRQSVSDDQPLVDELSRDADPLVREIAVMSLGRMGVLVDGERIEPLLKDSSPNVRTAVLRALTEHPSEKTIKSLCAYLQQETNEDLLVHGAKSLGQLGPKEETLATLATLANNESWRVRAAAIEVAGQIMANGNVSQEPIHRVVNGKIETIQPGSGDLPESLTKAIVKAAFEEDKFVAERALQLLPQLIIRSKESKGLLEDIAVELGDHPDRLRVVVALETPSLRAQKFSPLVTLAKEWLLEENGTHTKQAAVLLSQLAPTELNDRLANMIASDNRFIRLAGMRAAIDSAMAYRLENINSARMAWNTSGENEAKITPWYDLPESETEAEPATVPDQDVPAAEPADEKSNGDDDPKDDIETSADELFGAAPSDEESNSTPTPAAIPPSALPAPQNEAIKAVEGLFGNPLTPPLPPPTVQLAPPAVIPSAIAKFSSADAELALPSKWMERWQRGSTGDRPDWFAACDAPTQKLLESNDPQERAWALTLWLVLGHTDQIEELHASLITLKTDDKPASEDLTNVELLSWLPSEQRLAELERRITALEGDSEKIMELLTQATWVNDPAMAAWLFEYLDNPALADAQHDTALADIVIRTLIGFAAEQLPTALVAENYNYSDKPPYRLMNSEYTPQLPGRVEACEWLRGQFKDKASDRQRAIALIALAKLDHQTAVDAAIGAIQEADAESEMLEVALAIALFDAPLPSAQRAVGLLSHAVPNVQRAALKVLASPAMFLHLHEPSPVPTVDNSAVILPGLWLATQSYPVEVLREWSTKGDALEQAQAKLLLVAAGEKVDLAEVESQFEAQNTNYGAFCVATALAKSGRTDEAAVNHYESTYEGAVDDQISAALYTVLRNLKGEEIAVLRRRMREEKGANLFNSQVAPPIPFSSP